jgi:membrane-bound lytic murein transglycosylase MltF
MTWPAAVAVALLVLVGCSSPAPTGKPAAAPARKSIPVAASTPPPPAATLATMTEPAFGDLDAIATRGYLRVLVTISRTQYSVIDGMQRGETFDAGMALQTHLDSKVHVVFVPTPEHELVTRLVAGRGDVAANLLVTFERDDQVAFAEPIRKGVREFVVTGPASKPLVSLEDVGGLAIHVRKSSDHHASLVRLNDQLKKVDRPGCRIVIAHESLTDEDLAEQVNSGAIPATLLDDHLYRRLKPALDKLSANEEVAVSQDGIVAWAVRKDAPKLLALVNEFFRSVQ